MQHVVQQEGVHKQLSAMGNDRKDLVALEQARSRVSVVLRLDCTADDVLDSYVHAYMVLHAKQPLVGSLQYHMSLWEKADLLCGVQTSTGLAQKGFFLPGISVRSPLLPHRRKVKKI